MYTITTVHVQCCGIKFSCRGLKKGKLINTTNQLYQTK